MTVSLVQVKQGLSPLLEQRGDEQMKVKPTKAPRKRKWELLLQLFREEGPRRSYHVPTKSICARAKRNRKGS
jgi:hypothetical protein